MGLVWVLISVKGDQESKYPRKEVMQMKGRGNVAMAMEISNTVALGGRAVDQQRLGWGENRRRRSMTTPLFLFPSPTFEKTKTTTAVLYEVDGKTHTWLQRASQLIAEILLTG